MDILLNKRNIDYITIPGADFIQGSNTLHFRESNSFPTKFEWTLYINQGAVTEENITALTYDMYGNKTSLTDGLNNTTLFGYDSHQVYLASLTNAFNQTITATYDFNKGLATSITDARGNTTSFEYDILGRVTKRIQPDPPN